MSVENAKRIMMGHFASTARKFGLSELYGYIYGVLFFEDGPMSLGEIAERTGYSLSHVSSALKFLENLGLVVRIKKPGDRKAYYKAVKNIQEWRRAAYYKRILEDVRETRESLLKALKELEGEDGKEAERIRESVELLLKKNLVAEKIAEILSKGDEEVLETIIDCIEKRSKRTSDDGSGAAL